MDPINKVKKKDRFRNGDQKMADGYSIVSILVGIAISGLVMMGVAQYYVQFNKSGDTLSGFDDAIDLQRLVTKSLSCNLTPILDLCNEDTVGENFDVIDGYDKHADVVIKSVGADEEPQIFAGKYYVRLLCVNDARTPSGKSFRVDYAPKDKQPQNSINIAWRDLYRGLPFPCKY